MNYYEVIKLILFCIFRFNLLCVKRFDIFQIEITLSITYIQSSLNMYSTKTKLLV